MKDFTITLRRTETYQSVITLRADSKPLLEFLLNNVDGLEELLEWNIIEDSSGNDGRSTLRHIYTDTSSSSEKPQVHGAAQRLIDSCLAKMPYPQ